MTAPRQTRQTKQRGTGRTFYHRHYIEVADLLATCDESDLTVQAMACLFGQKFQDDWPNFDFPRWQSYLTRQREGRQKND